MRKSRAQEDADKLKRLQEAQEKVDSGSASIAQVESELENDGIDLGESNLDQNGNIREPEVAKPVEPVQEQQRVSSEEYEDLQRQIKAMKRTISQYEQEINPAQRRAQELEREVDELRHKLSAIPSAPESPLDYGLTEEEQEFDTVKSIAEKVNKTNLSRVEKKLLEHIDSLKSELDKIKKSNADNELDMSIAKHKSELTHIIGEDPTPFFSNPKLIVWADTLAEEEVLALRNPLAYSPKFVAGLITRFKSEVKGQVKREPSHGESGVPSRVAPDVIENKTESTGSDPVFNQRTFQADVNRLISNGETAKAERLIAIAEKSMA